MRSNLFLWRKPTDFKVTTGQERCFYLVFSCETPWADQPLNLGPSSALGSVSARSPRSGCQRRRPPRSDSPPDALLCRSAERLRPWLVMSRRLGRDGDGGSHHWSQVTAPWQGGGEPGSFHHACECLQEIFRTLF